MKIAKIKIKLTSKAPKSNVNLVQLKKMDSLKKPRPSEALMHELKTEPNSNLKFGRGRRKKSSYSASPSPRKYRSKRSSSGFGKSSGKGGGK